MLDDKCCVLVLMPVSQTGLTLK